MFVFFFFQAEDGIRDRNVTGVQTCALPIFLTVGTPRSRRITAARRRTGNLDPPLAQRQGTAPPIGRADAARHRGWAREEIGRASCRERGSGGGEGGGAKRRKRWTKRTADRQ